MTLDDGMHPNAEGVDVMGDTYPAHDRAPGRGPAPDTIVFATAFVGLIPGFGDQDSSCTSRSLASI